MTWMSVLPGALSVLPWSRVITEFATFLGYFGIFGALGFRAVVVRVPAPGNEALSGLALIGAPARRRAAGIGCAAVLLLIPGLSGGKEANIVAISLAAVVLVAFTLAARGVRGAWVGAGVTALAFAFQSITKGKWLALVNPLHMVAASLWLGTLFVFVAAGLSVMLSGALPREQRGPLVARMVARFSVLALCASAVLFSTGLVTAWVHLKFLAALWTTAYGQTLLVKLGVVAVVASVGAYNWRRLTPRLGGESAAFALRRSSSVELGVALLVLVVTAVLVTVPSPKPPQAPALPEGPAGRPTAALPQR